MEKCRTLVIAVCKGIEHCFTSDEALDRGYLRWKGHDGVPHALSLLRGCLRFKLVQDCDMCQNYTDLKIGFEDEGELPMW